jgi:hypothetical protein
LWVDGFIFLSDLLVIFFEDEVGLWRIGTIWFVWVGGGFLGWEGKFVYSL